MSRQIKIQSDIRQKKGFYRDMRDRVEFPVLRLRGLWLMEAGPSKLHKMKENAYLRDDAFVITENELLRMINNCMINIDSSGSTKTMCIKCDDGRFYLVEHDLP